jgi:hypothetical protein
MVRWRDDECSDHARDVRYRVRWDGREGEQGRRQSYDNDADKVRYRVR